MSISATYAEAEDILTITVKGRFDFSSLQAFRNTYENLPKKPAHYVIELAESDYLDSSALGMLLALRDYAGGDTADIRIAHCNPDIRKILVITKLDELFKVE